MAFRLLVGNCVNGAREKSGNAMAKMADLAEQQLDQQKRIADAVEKDDDGEVVDDI